MIERVYISDAVIAEVDGRLHMIGRSSSGEPRTIGPLHPEIWHAPAGTTAWSEDERVQIVVKSAAACVEDWHREHAQAVMPGIEAIISLLPRPKSQDHDPLGREESDVVARLHGMAEDALARKGEAAVDEEVARARELLGLRKGGR